MIKLTQILKESSNDNLDNPVYRKYLNALVKKNPQFIDEAKGYIHPKLLRDSKIFNHGYSNFYGKLSKFFGSGFFDLDSDRIKDLIFLFMINLDVKNFLTDELNVGQNFNYLRFSFIEPGYDYNSSDEWVDCDYCDGIGSSRDDCQTCDGSGEVMGDDDETYTCNDCGGSGEVDNDCSYCGGDGGWDEEKEWVEKTEVEYKLILDGNPNIDRENFHSKYDNNVIELINEIQKNVYLITSISSDVVKVDVGDEDELPKDNSLQYFELSKLNKFDIRYII